MSRVLLRRTVPEATTSTYDQLNRLDLLKGPGGATIADFDYDALSRRTQLKLANTTTTTYAYDAASRLLTLSHFATSPLSHFTYTYDAVGNRRTLATQADGQIVLSDCVMLHL